jgi:hypothetical protein
MTGVLPVPLSVAAPPPITKRTAASTAISSKGISSRAAPSAPRAKADRSREHVNTRTELKELIKKMFEDVNDEAMQATRDLSTSIVAMKPISSATHELQIELPSTPQQHEEEHEEESRALMGLEEEEDSEYEERRVTSRHRQEVSVPIATVGDGTKMYLFPEDVNDIIAPRQDRQPNATWSEETMELKMDHCLNIMEELKAKEGQAGILNSTVIYSKFKAIQGVQQLVHHRVTRFHESSKVAAEKVNKLRWARVVEKDPSLQNNQVAKSHLTAHWNSLKTWFNKIDKVLDALVQGADCHVEKDTLLICPGIKWKLLDRASITTIKENQDLFVRKGKLFNPVFSVRLSDLHNAMNALSVQFNMHPEYLVHRHISRHHLQKRITAVEGEIESEVSESEEDSEGDSDDESATSKPFRFFGVNPDPTVRIPGTVITWNYASNDDVTTPAESETPEEVSVVTEPTAAVTTTSTTTTSATTAVPITTTVALPEAEASSAVVTTCDALTSSTVAISEADGASALVTTTTASTTITVVASEAEGASDTVTTIAATTIAATTAAATSTGDAAASTTAIIAESFSEVVSIAPATTTEVAPTTTPVVTTTALPSTSVIETTAAPVIEPSSTASLETATTAVEEAQDGESGDVTVTVAPTETPLSSIEQTVETPSTDPTSAPTEAPTTSEHATETQPAEEASTIETPTESQESGSGARGRGRPRGRGRGKGRGKRSSKR